MEQSSRNNVDKKMLTAVIGNLDGLGPLAAAQAWLKKKLSYLNGPKATNIYVNGSFQEMIFAEFPDQFTVTLLRTADLKRDGKDTRVAQGRNPVERATRNFCFGWKHLFKNEWNIPYPVRITKWMSETCMPEGGPWKAQVKKSCLYIKKVCASQKPIFKIQCKNW